MITYLKLINRAALATVLLAGTTLASISNAQLIQSGGATYQFITLTVPGPIIVMGTTLATATGAGHSQLQAVVSSNSTVNATLLGPEQTVAQNSSGAPASIDQGTTSLPPGNYEVAFNYVTQFTLIAPNEPGAGAAAAIATLQGEINQNTTDITGLQTQLNTINTTLQGEITTDENNIATLQGQIGALQNQTNANTSAIATLQNQLATVQQNQVTDEGNITALQTAQTNLAAKEQNDINHLQNQINGIQPGSSTVVTNNAHKQNNALAYAGVGLGIVAIGIGVGDIISQGSSNAAGTATPQQTTLKPMTYSESTARTYPGR